MSYQTRLHPQTVRMAIYGLPLSATAKLVLLCHLDHSDWKSWTARMATKTCADRTGLHQRTIRRMLGLMEGKCLITRESFDTKAWKAQLEVDVIVAQAASERARRKRDDSVGGPQDVRIGNLRSKDDKLTWLAPWLRPFWTHPNWEQICEETLKQDGDAPDWVPAELAADWGTLPFNSGQDTFRSDLDEK